eukprot:7415527-Karenia_brevis.AAC.1
MSQAGAIMAVSTGAFWPVNRLGPEDDMYKYPFCHMARYDQAHLFYTCPKLLTNRHPMIVKTQHLVETARRDNHNPPCYYLKGAPAKG